MFGANRGPRPSADGLGPRLARNRGDPLGGLSGPPLGGPSCEAWEAGLPPDLVPDAMQGVNGRLLYQTVCELIAGHTPMGQDPPERGLVVSVHQASADLDDGSGPLLAQPQGVCGDPSNLWLGTRENCVPTAGLLACLEDL